MTDSFTDTSSVGYFARIGNAAKGALAGLVFLIVAVVLLFWNEGRAVKTARMLSQGAAAVVSVDPSRIVPSNEGKLVHFAADAKGAMLTDPLFHVSRDAIHLRRIAEMYQWRESKESQTHKQIIGGGTTTQTTYTYNEIWSAKPIDSSGFHVRAGHENPASSRIGGGLWTAAPIRAGAFTIPPELAGHINNYAPIALADNELSQLPEDLRHDTAILDGKCYVSGQTGHVPDPASPQLGDVRLTLDAAPQGPVSVIGRQTGDSISAYLTPSGGQLELLSTGTHSAQEMFATEQQNNRNLTWLLRLAGFVILWIAFAALMQPVKVIADLVGIIGDLVGIGVGIVSLLAATGVSAITIALAWVVYRPLLGYSLFAAAVAAGVGLIALWLRSGARRRAAATPAPIPATAPH